MIAGQKHMPDGSKTGSALTPTQRLIVQTLQRNGALGAPTEMLRDQINRRRGRTLTKATLRVHIALLKRRGFQIVCRKEWLGCGGYNSTPRTMSCRYFIEGAA